MTGSSLATRLSRREVVTVVTLGAWALAYLVAHLVAFYLPDTEQVTMAAWPAAGIGLAALLLSLRASCPRCCRPS